MTVFDVERVLNNAMQSFMQTTSLEFDVSWPNTHYTPVVGKDYIKVDFVPANSTPVGVGAESKTRETGFYQLAINISANVGKANMVNIVEELKPFFKQGSSLSFSGVDVRVMRFRPLMSISDSDWYTQFVRIDWRSDILN